jgi:hypothetical protein
MIGGVPEKEFHDSAEGLGILMQLSPQPGLQEAETLIARLNLLGYAFGKTISGLTGDSGTESAAPEEHKA